MHRKGYKISYVERIRNVMHAMFAQVYKSEIIYRNPVSSTTTPREKERTERRVLTHYEQETFLKCAEDTEFEDVFYLGFSTGMRISEILALEWSKVDFAKSVKRGVKILEKAYIMAEISSKIDIFGKSKNN